MQILNTMYDSLQIEDPIRSRFELNEEEMSGSEAASFIQNELLLDDTLAFTLAGFATTYMGIEVENLMLKKPVISPRIMESGLAGSRR